jgi:16S rRNA (guanine(966)-N(2))-methyltransferase RsmD
MTRIISGRLRGKRLHAPRTLDARPTTDFAKESLFNILENQYHWDETTALDLFTGTGNLALELASRGTQAVVAVDIAQASTRYIQRTAEALGLDKQVTVVQREAVAFLQRDFRQYELILADPPYDYPDYATLVETIYGQSLLSPEGLLVVEHHERTSLDQLPHFQRSRKYGKVRFSFFSATSLP